MLGRMRVRVVMMANVSNAVQKKKEEEHKINFSSELERIKTPGREAAMKDHSYMKMADDEPKRNFQIPVYSKEDQIGWCFRVHIEKVPTFIIPKHFFDEDCSKYPNLSLRMNGQTHIIDCKRVGFSQHYDYAWFVDPKCMFGKIAPMCKDVSLRGQVSLIVERNKVMQWSVTDTLQPPNDKSGEICYKAPTDLGDCGVPVYQNNLVVGMHVGTDGANAWNKFIPLALVLAEVNRRQSA